MDCWKRVMSGDGMGFGDLNEKTKASRVAFEANSKDREAVKLIAGHKIGQDRIDLALGISDRTLRKHFKRSWRTLQR